MQTIVTVYQDGSHTVRYPLPVLAEKRAPVVVSEPLPSISLLVSIFGDIASWAGADDQPPPDAAIGALVRQSGCTRELAAQIVERMYAEVAS